jgi:hypothetical protein
VCADIRGDAGRRSKGNIRAVKATAYPRYELIDEYRRESEGKSVRLLSFYELLREMQAAEQVVKEVEQVEVEANNAIAVANAVNKFAGISARDLSRENKDALAALANAPSQLVQFYKTLQKLQKNKRLAETLRKHEPPSGTNEEEDDS